MEYTSVQRLARVLRVLVIIMFVCNLLALVMVPGMAMMRGSRELTGGISCFGAQGEHTGQIFWRFLSALIAAWSEIWTYGTEYARVLAVFLFFCGCCTAVILWQAKRVLEGILKGETFTCANAGNMKRAAICCLVISGAALLRTVWGLFYYGSLAPLFTYNFLFVPVFLIAGLVCMVMSALFRQAAEIKAENDLTI